MRVGRQERAEGSASGWLEGQWLGYSEVITDDVIVMRYGRVRVCPQ
jgi:hypothetical protein